MKHMVTNILEIKNKARKKKYRDYRGELNIISEYLNDAMIFEKR